MAGAVAKYAAKKMLSKEMDKYKTKSPGVESQYVSGPPFARFGNNS